MKILRVRSLVRYATALLTQWREGNLGRFDNLLQSLQLSDRLSQLTASGIRPERLNKPCISQESPCILGQDNYNKYKEFLCEYRFKGERYCISIMATSWEEAEQRLRYIASNGKIVGGPVLLNLKIPFT